LAVGGPGHQVHQTWIPAIISFGDTPKTVCTTPICTLLRSCYMKPQLLLKI